LRWGKIYINAIMELIKNVVSGGFWLHDLGRFQNSFVFGNFDQMFFNVEKFRHYK